MRVQEIPPFNIMLSPLMLGEGIDFDPGILSFLVVDRMGERNGAFLALCLLLVGEFASENLVIFAANVLSSVAQKMCQVRRGIF